MECFHRRIPYASWRLKVFRQLFLSDRVHPTLVSTITTSSQSSAQHDGKRDTSTLNDESSDKPQEKKSSGEEQLRPSKLLPQSPLLTHPHPRDKKRKKRPTTEDEGELRRNPWAVALASPPRMCYVSGTRLPKEFLGDWGMIQRPGSDKLWFMPVGLLKDQTLASSAKNTVNSTMRRSLSMLKLRIVDRIPLLKQLTPILSRRVKKPRIMKLIPFRWKPPYGPITQSEEKNILWREDMPDFVLERMRKEVLKKLEKVSLADSTKSRIWNEIDMDGFSEDALVEGLKRMELFDRMETGAVLIIGRPQKGNEAAIDLHLESFSSDLAKLPLLAFPGLITLPHTQTKVPVFDLSSLLSDTDMEELRGYHPRFSKSALFFRPNNSVTVEAMLALWKLKGMLRPDRNHSSLHMKF